MKTWINGQFVDKDSVRVSIETGALHYGTSVFDGILCVGSTNKKMLFRLKEHLDRLLQSASVLGLKTPYTLAQLSSAISQLLKINNLGSCYIRPLIFDNANYLQLLPTQNNLTVAFICQPLNFYKFFFQMRKPLKIIALKSAMTYQDSGLIKAKVSGKYLNSTLALLQAKKDGFDDAVIIDHQNIISETTAANLFIVKDKRLKTPLNPITLNGIVRESVIQIARDCGYPVFEEKICLEELYTADEIFMTGTVKGIISVNQVSTKKIINPQKQSIAKEIRKTYLDILTGKNNRYKEWLTIL